MNDKSRTSFLDAAPARTLGNLMRLASGRESAALGEYNCGPQLDAVGEPRNCFSKAVGGVILASGPPDLACRLLPRIFRPPPRAMTVSQRSRRSGPPKRPAKGAMFHK